MKIKLDEPTIPNDIRQKIRNLRVLLDLADNLRDEILAWYTAELKSYDFRADAQQELFNPGTGTTVEGISELAIMEALSELQIMMSCCGWRESVPCPCHGHVIPFPGDSISFRLPRQPCRHLPRNSPAEPFREMACPFSEQ